MQYCWYNDHANGNGLLLGGFCMNGSSVKDDVFPPEVDRDIVSCVSGFRSSLIATSDIMKERWEPSSNRMCALMWLL